MHTLLNHEFPRAELYTTPSSRPVLPRYLALWRVFKCPACPQWTVQHITWEHYGMDSEPLSPATSPTSFLPDAQPPSSAPCHSLPLTLGAWASASSFWWFRFPVPDHPWKILVTVPLSWELSMWNPDSTYFLSLAGAVHVGKGKWTFPGHYMCEGFYSEEPGIILGSAQWGRFIICVSHVRALRFAEVMPSARVPGGREKWVSPGPWFWILSALCSKLASLSSLLPWKSCGRVIFF